MKNNKFLKYYAIAIAIALIAIMFIIPDSFYLDLESKKNRQTIKITETETKDFLDIQKQKENLLTKDHEYEYLMSEVIGTTMNKASCTGKIVDGVETGTCTTPQNVSYTKENKKDTILSLNVKYLDLEYIFKLIKDIEPTEISYNKTRELLYKTKILDLETEITIYTDLNNITQINISNAYMTYLFKYNNIKD